MIIVLEGVDNSGKSTLATKLQALTGYRLVHSGGREKYPGEINDRVSMYMYLDVYKNDVIFDRHPCVSQTLYGATVGKNTPVRQDLLERFYQSKPFFVYCRRFLPVLDDHQADPSHGDTPEYLQRLHDAFPPLVAAYDSWASSRAHYIYRVGEPLEPLLRLFGPDLVADIAAFHTKFGLEYQGPPRWLPQALYDFRTGFMQEELNEYAEAGSERNMAKALDALVDEVYVVLGTAHLHGFDFREAWRRVHAANMRKVRATDASQSKRNSTSDVIKPEGWQPPDLSDLVAGALSLGT